MVSLRRHASRKARGAKLQRVAFITLLLTACGMSGCLADAILEPHRWGRPGADESGSPAPATPGPTQSTSNPLLTTNDAEALGLRPTVTTALAVPLLEQSSRRLVLRLLLARVPASKAVHADLLWNYASSANIPPDMHQRLTRNGLRVGVGHTRDWVAIQAALNSIDGMYVTEPEPIEVRRRLPIFAEVHSEDRTTTVFTFDPDGQAVGWTLGASRGGFELFCVSDPLDPNRTLLTVAPAFRQNEREYRELLTPQGRVKVSQPVQRRFPEAGLDVALRSGEFLVIAPGDLASTRWLLGRELLTDELADGRYHYYVFARPQIESSDDA